MKDKDEYVGYMEDITSGISHELSNTLSIIKENSGLLEDLFSMAEKSGVEIPFADRMKKSLASIKLSLKKSVEITSDLNRFSHLVHDQNCIICAHEAVSLMARINSKRATRSGLTIEVESKAREMQIMAIPALFCRLIHLTICAAINASESGGIVSILLHEDHEGKKISISNEKSHLGFSNRFSSTNQHMSIHRISNQLGLKLMENDSKIVIEF